MSHPEVDLRTVDAERDAVHASRAEGSTVVTSRASLLAPPEDVPAPAEVRVASFRPIGDPGRTARRHLRERLAPLLGPLHLMAKVVVVLGLCWGLFFNLSEVRGSSMMPGIHDHDRILIDQVSYLFSAPGHGDVVVLRYPLDPSLDYVKRVVALPGEEVHIEDGRLWVDGIEVQEPYVAAAAVDPYTRLRTVVRPGHYFVLGDNRLRSSDSREFGQVPHDLLVGKVRARLWPLERIGLVR